MTEAFNSDRAGFHAEYRIVRPDGSVRWISDRSFPVRNAQGALVRIAGVATDETNAHNAGVAAAAGATSGEHRATGGGSRTISITC